MQLYIQYVEKKGAVLIHHWAIYPNGRASEQELQKFAKKELDNLNLSQRCAKDIVSAIVYTVATKADFE